MASKEKPQAADGGSDVDLQQVLTESIKQYPLSALGIAAGAGFILGGGLRSRVGIAVILFAGRQVAQEVMLPALATLIDEYGKRNLKTSGATRRSGDRSPAEPVRGKSEGRSGRSPASG